jgi:hypothetical protein
MSSNLTLKNQPAKTQPKNLPANLNKLLDKLPADAIINVVNVVGEVFKANKLMEIKDQEFQNQIQIIQSQNTDRNERLKLLMEFISNPKLPETSVSQIVSSICKIAEG